MWVWEATVCIDTGSPFSWFQSLTRQNISHWQSHSHQKYSPLLISRLFHQWSGGVEEGGGEREGGSVGGVLQPGLHLTLGSSPPFKRQHIESSVLSFSSLKQLFGREKNNLQIYTSFSVLEIGFSFPTRSSSSFFKFHYKGGKLAWFPENHCWLFSRQRGIVQITNAMAKNTDPNSQSYKALSSSSTRVGFFWIFIFLFLNIFFCNT